MYKKRQEPPADFLQFLRKACGTGRETDFRIRSAHLQQNVSMCYNLMVEELAKDAARTKAAEPQNNFPTPTRSRRIWMSSSSVRTIRRPRLSVAVYNHLQTSALPKDAKSRRHEKDVEVDKVEPASRGPGKQKTLLAQTLARFLDVLLHCGCDRPTEAGYVGEDVENILVRFYSRLFCGLRCAYARNVESFRG